MIRHVSHSSNRRGERGNVLFIILLAVVLIGTLTAVLQNTSSNSNANIDDETLLIRVTEIKRYASELERAITFVREQGAGEEDIRFASPTNSDYGTYSDAETQIFAPLGGGAKYRTPPRDVLADPTADGQWEFYATTAIPSAGRDTRSELIAVLPNVSERFCGIVNKMNNVAITHPADDESACIYAGDSARFSGSYLVDGDVGFNDSFSDDFEAITPAPVLQACVQCDSDGAYHFYHVLMSR